MIPAWCNRWVSGPSGSGIPFLDKGRGEGGFDCWGLARAVLAEQFGVEGLPDYSDAYSGARNRDSVTRAVRAGLSDGWAQVAEPREGDLIILRLAARPWHCAVAVGDGWMIHVLQDVGVCCERLSSPVWRNRIEGVYRHG